MVHNRCQIDSAHSTHSRGNFDWRTTYFALPAAWMWCDLSASCGSSGYILRGLRNCGPSLAFVRFRMPAFVNPVGFLSADHATEGIRAPGLWNMPAAG